MDLFKLFGTIAVDNSEANKALDETGSKGVKTESKLSNAFSNIGKSIANGFKKEPIDKTKSSLSALTSTVDGQNTKLKSLKDKYADLYLTHGKNSKEARDCAAEIKKLSGELDKNQTKLSTAENAADKFDKTIEKVGNTADKSNSKLSKFFSAAGKGALAVGKTVATGMLAAGTAVAGLATKSIQSYAEYEQLVGGVETLFKDSSAKVQEYAANAYKTAGMSANDYMETVTGFSASLLQSLDGDTAAAAEKADMAITDMSDNANKMGTDISMIQNAYQGFAKQNYTMLDNLKLGYGGTQEEMARLLADATAISGIEYDISSYADIVDAIHVIQTEMGITGTTAKEASSTISGSISSMKGSWQNLLTAISSDDLPFDDYVNNFIDSVSTVADNLLPRIEIALNGVVSLIDKLAPLLISKIPGLLSSLLPSIITAATGLMNSIVSALPSLIDMLVNTALPQLLSGIVTIFNALVSALPSVVESLVAALPALIPQLVNGLVSMIVTLCTVLPQIIQPIIDYLPDIIIAIVDALMNNLPALIQGAVQLVVGLVAALPQIIMGLIQALPTIISSIVSGLWNSFPALLDGIIQIATSLWESLKSLVSGLISTIGEWLAPVAEVVSAFFVDLWTSISQWFSDTWNSISQWFSDVWSGVSQWFSDIWSGVSQWFTDLWQGVVDVFNKIKDAIWIAIQLIASILDAAFQIITLPFRFIWENCKEYIFAAWEWIKNIVSTAINAVSEVITNVMTAIGSFFSSVWNSISSVFTNVWNSIVNFLTPIINSIKNAITTAFNAIKSTASTVWNSIKSAITTAVNAVKSAVSTAFNAVKNTVSTVFNSVKNTVSNVWNGVKTTISNVVNNIKSTISNVFNSVKTTVGNIFNSIKEKMSAPIEKARDLIKGIVDKIKGFFSGLKISFPSIKLPHFSIKPKGWKIGDLLEGSIPSLGIEWYAKAMKNPMVMTQPTIFGYNSKTGQLQGGGEAGTEVVSGATTLMNMIRAAVAGQNDALVYYLQKLTEMLADYFPQVIAAAGHDIVTEDGLIVAHYAPMLNTELGKISSRKDRGR